MLLVGSSEGGDFRDELAWTAKSIVAFEPRDDVLVIGVGIEGVGLCESRLHIPGPADGEIVGAEPGDRRIGSPVEADVSTGAGGEGDGGVIGGRVRWGEAN